MNKYSLLFNAFLLGYTFIVLILSELFINIYFVSFSFSIYFILILTFFRINKFNVFSLNMLFIFFCFIFIGGRFISCDMEFLFGAEQIVFSIPDLFNQERMISTNYSIEESLFIYRYIILWFGSFYFGSILYKYKHDRINYYPSLCKKCTVIKVIFFLSLLTIVLLKGLDLYKVYQTGYISLYIRSEEVVWKGTLVFFSMTLLIASFAFINSNQYSKFNSKYIYLLGVIDLIIGKRGEFISKIIGAFSVNNKVNKLNFMKIFIYIIFLFLFLNFIMFFSFRENEFSFNIKIIDAIAQLLFSQGTTLGVISYSILDVESVNVRLSIKSFIPGINFFYTTFFNEIPFYERSIGQLISFRANEGLYMNGGGLGSSILSESYLIFGYLLSLIFAFIFGFLLSHIEFKKNSTHFFKYLWIVAIFLVPMLPRSGVSNFSVSVTVFIITYQILKFTIYKRKDIK